MVFFYFRAATAAGDGSFLELFISLWYNSLEYSKQSMTIGRTIMNYTRMNLKEWSRGDLCQFYIDKMRIVMSLTVDMDVTNLKE